MRAEQQVTTEQPIPADQQGTAPAARRTVPLWVLVTACLAVVAAAIGALGLVVAGSLPERNGPPVEQV